MLGKVQTRVRCLFLTHAVVLHSKRNYRPTCRLFWLVSMNSYRCTAEHSSLSNQCGSGLELRRGDRFYSSFFCSSSQNSTAKLVHVCQSYHKDRRNDQSATFNKLITYDIELIHYLEVSFTMTESQSKRTKSVGQCISCISQTIKLFAFITFSPVTFYLSVWFCEVKESDYHL